MAQLDSQFNLLQQCSNIFVNDYPNGRTITTNSNAQYIVVGTIYTYG